MTQVLQFVLTLVLLYGYPIIFVAILVESIGLPLPGSALLLAAGSFTVDGTLNIYLLTSLVIIAAVLGDIIAYYLGKRFGKKLLTVVSKQLNLNTTKLDTINSILKKWGFGYIFITRWLITPLSLPINILAGMNNYPFSRFFIADVLGELVWAVIYIYLGNLFGANWQSLLDYISSIPQILALLIIGISSLWIAKRVRKPHSY